MSHLVPCDGCGRHVLASEPRCPFCAAAFDAHRPVPGSPGARIGRAATFAFGAALAAATASGCGDSHGRGDAAVENDAGGGEDPDAGVAPPYGTPPEDA
ncbi:MAG TPA: hypothetical protein RMH99_20040, partial [Sandaracinaceae bacterium LLY-WYZ-13_1]|nr:hypothetical protein [Sandaracinaceae bacterium LLY-WYZ-13_1]